MILYLVQHAEALSKEEDPSRSLSEKGIEDITRIAEYAKGMNVEVHQVVHSGKMRSLQTAQVLAEHIIVDMNVLESDGLSPMDDPDIWFDRLLKMDRDIMLVGHLPHMSGLASLLLCGDKKKKTVNFDMGCIVRLERSGEDGWAIDWIVKPGMVA